MKHHFFRYFFLFFLLALFLTGAACAADGEDILWAQADALDIAGLERAAGEYGSEQRLTPNISLDAGLQSLLGMGQDLLFGIGRKAVRSGVMLLVIVLLCGLAEGMYGSVGKTGLDTVAVAGALAVTAVAVADVSALIGLGRRVLSDMEGFSKVLLPTITAATAASGAPGGAVARQLATMLFSDVLLSLISRLLLPLVYAYVAACTAYAALGNEGLKRISSTLKWTVTLVLTSVLLLFVGYLTVSGVIAGTADAATIKAAKFTVSSVVPVVGGILSDAAETVLAGAGILRNAVGVFGMLAVLSMCLAPFLQLGVHYLTYKGAAALTATVSGGRVAGLIDNISGAFGLVLGMTGASALLLLISMVSAISVVTV